MFSEEREYGNARRELREQRRKNYKALCLAQGMDEAKAEELSSKQANAGNLDQPGDHKACGGD